MKTSNAAPPSSSSSSLDATNVPQPSGARSILTVTQSASNLLPHNQPQPNSSVSKASVEKTVLGVLRETERRRKNIVISGLKEEYMNRDVTRVNSLLTDHVKCPNSINIVSCTRVGKANDPLRPRKVLVRLESEADATAVLRYAKSLRISTDSEISANVFINADLSRTESQLAYEKRQARRNRVPSTAGVTTSSATGGASATSQVRPVVQSVVASSPATSSLRPTAAQFNPSASNPIPVVSARQGLPSTSADVTH